MKTALLSDTWCDSRHVLSNRSISYTDVVSDNNQTMIRQAMLWDHTSHVMLRHVIIPDHVKRPLNKFMLYSKLERPKIREENPQMNQKDISSSSIHHTAITAIVIVPESKQWRASCKYENKAIDLKHLHKTEFPDYKYKPKRIGTSTKKTRYFSEGLQQVQPAIHHSTRQFYMMSTTNPELNYYSLGSISGDTLITLVYLYTCMTEAEHSEQIIGPLKTDTLPFSKYVFRSVYRFFKVINVTFSRYVGLHVKYVTIFLVK